MIRWVIATVGVLVLALLAAGLWLRVMPISADAYHRMGTEQNAVGDWRDSQGFEAVRQVPAPQASLEALTKIATAAKRTTLLEGTVQEELVTFVTRSPVLGLPEITNLWIEGNRIHLRGHTALMDFGLGDEAARAEARIRDWMARAGMN
ncbi:MAG TPA: hypothetical protein VGC40_11220 [Paenirhodobacter sp.]